MAITVHDTTSTSAGGSSLTTLSWSHTVSAGDNRKLIVAANAEHGNSTPPNISGITYGGVALTKAVDTSHTEGSGVLNSELWYLDNPTVGTATITATYSAAYFNAAGLSETLHGARTGGPEATAVNSTSTDTTTISQSVTTITANAAVLSTVVANVAGNFTSGQTLDIAVNDGALGIAAALSSANVASPGSQSMSWTLSATWNRAAMVVAAFPAVQAYSLAADSGSFTLSGQAATIQRSLQLPADQGSFVLSGQAASLLLARNFSAAQGSFAMAGQDAGFARALSFAAAQGSFTLAGQDASFIVARSWVAGYGAFTLAGQDAGFQRTLLWAAAHGSFVLSGQDVAFGVQKAPLVADVGLFTLTWQSVAINTGRLFTANYGAFALNGQDVFFRLARAWAADYGTFALSGQAVGFVRGVRFPADYGAFVLAGQDAAFDVSGVSGYLAVTEAQDVAYIVGTAVGSGQFTVSGPYVIHAFQTDGLSYPYDVRQRTA